MYKDWILACFKYYPRICEKGL